MNADASGGALDLKVALSHVDDDLQLLSELAVMFLEDYPHLIDESHAAIARHDCAVLERSAHTLKGRLAFFGITKLHGNLVQLETMGREKDLRFSPQTLSAIEDGMAPILTEIKALIKEPGVRSQEPE
jgi:two-component system, sensor histidine kinase and response regulator